MGGGGGGQIFGLFKRVYFMDDPNTKMSGRRLRLDYAVIEQNINISKYKPLSGSS